MTNSVIPKSSRASWPTRRTAEARRPSAEPYRRSGSSCLQEARRRAGFSRSVSPVWPCVRPSFPDGHRRGSAPLSSQITEQGEENRRKVELKRAANSGQRRQRVTGGAQRGQGRIAELSRGNPLWLAPKALPAGCGKHAVSGARTVPDLPLVDSAANDRSQPSADPHARCSTDRTIDKEVGKEAFADAAAQPQHRAEAAIRLLCRECKLPGCHLVRGAHFDDRCRS